MTSHTHQGRLLTSYRSILLGALQGVADEQKNSQRERQDDVELVLLGLKVNMLLMYHLWIILYQKIQ